jgi:sRNA-binding carbon storage regulator CsrA
MLKLDLRPGDAVAIDDGRVIVRVEEKTGPTVRLAVDAPPEVKIEKQKAAYVNGRPSTRRLAPIG